MTEEVLPDPHQDKYSKTIFGFWLYLLTDFVLFATIMATYFVLRNSTMGGPTAADLLPLDYVFLQTFVLLACSFFVGVGGASVHLGKKWWTLTLFGITFFLGVVFLMMEFVGFAVLMKQGYNWGSSAFLSAYFTLLGTHAFHVVFALLWTIVLLVPVYMHGIEESSRLRLTTLRMFWQFLNVVWIAIFTIIYLMGID